MKIMLITKHYPPEIGAASVRMKSMMDSFSEQDDIEQITVIAFEPSIKSNRLRVHIKQSDKINIIRYSRKYLPRFFHLMHDSNPFTLAIVTLFSIRECRLCNPDIIIATTPPHFNFAIAAYITSVIYTKRLCFDIRDSLNGVTNYGSTHHHFFIRLPIKFLYNLMQRFFLHACKKTMLISAVYDSIQKRLLGENIQTPSIVIPNGIDFKELDRIKRGSDKREILSKHRIPYRGESKFVIYCGMSQKYYKPELLLIPLRKLLEKGMDIVYILVGDNTYVGEIAKNMGIEDHVFLLGSIEHSELIELLLISNVAFYALDNDFPNPDCALGVKFLEYVSCKLPVLSVANDNSAVSQVITTHEIGLTLSWNETDLLDSTLEKLLDNKKFIRNIENAYGSFVKKYDRCQNNYRLYQEIAEHYHKI